MCLRKRGTGNNHFRWTEDRLARLRTYRYCGLSPDEIAVKFAAEGLHDVQCVYYALRRLGMPMRGGKSNHRVPGERFKPSLMTSEAFG